MLGFWIFILLVVVLLFATPWWPYSRGWGYVPGGTILAIVVVWLVLIWMGWVVFAWPWAASPTM